MPSRAASSPGRAWRTGPETIQLSMEASHRSKRDAVSNMAVALDILIVELARRGVALVRVPVEPRPALGLGQGHQIVQECFSDAFAAGGGIDEQVFQIAIQRPCPGA